MKTQPTQVSVETFLESVSEQRQTESRVLIDMMQEISGLPPVMWGPSIIGFGTMHYKYETGREGDMPILAFSPRKASLTVYFEGFDDYAAELEALGKHKVSVGCLYITRLGDINLSVLRQMLEASYAHSTIKSDEPTSVDHYVEAVPVAARAKFDELRLLVKSQLPQAEEVLSYGIIGYKIDKKRARVFVSGWKDHVAMYPVPHSAELQKELKPYIKGKGTLWFKLDEPLPRELIIRSVQELAS